MLIRTGSRSWAALVVGAAAVLATPGALADGVDFAHEVAPILRKHCAKCHTGSARQGGYSFTDRALALAGGDSGQPAIVPGKPAESELFLRVTSAEPDLRMPKEGDALPAAAVDVLRRWIVAGAGWEEGFSFGGAVHEAPLELVPVELPPPHAGRTHPIDRILDAHLAAQGIPIPPPCDDATFIRRASLDLVGLLPEPAAVAAFVADGDPGKRARLVRDLLADDLARAEHWMTFWNDLLRNDYTGTGFITGGRRQITPWLHRALVDNMPFDRFVRELVAPGEESRGFADGIVWRGTVNASQTVPIQFAQNVGQTFLGINLKCASCHDSFVDRWTLKQTYDLAAIVSAEPLELERCDAKTGAVATPAWPFPELGQVDPAAPPAERRRQVAALLTLPRNGWLSRTLVNRLWQRLFGRGIVHPVDALRAPPFSPELLDWLAADLVAGGWDVRRSLETICTSAAYGAATPPVAGLPAAAAPFRGPLPRRLTAEQFVDALWQLTGAAPGRPDAEVARQRPDPAAPPSAPPTAAWIWSNAAAAAPPGEKLAFRKRVALPAAPVHGACVVTCDNEATVFVNGRKVATATAWDTPVTEIVTGALTAGDNEILVVAANAAAGGPAALRAELRIRLADGTALAVGSDAGWEWSAGLPNGKGRYATGKEPADWQPAVVVADQSTWGAADAPFAAGVSAATATGPLPMVRAVLVKCTPLQTALGRPNRDQVVTARPGELSTLEAIQLANDQSLADTLRSGAGRIRAACSDDPAAIAGAIFIAALARPPSAAEAAAVRDLLGTEPSDASVADCLWSVMMLPEFLFVR
jgi:hypothetical protein